MKINFLLVLLAILVTGNAQKKYKEGRAFPKLSLDYVKQKFKEINPEIGWDYTNYLEKIAADFASCNYGKGIFKGYAKIPDNESYVAFVEYVDMIGMNLKTVNDKMIPIIKSWVDEHTYDAMVSRATKFSCGLHPGCGIGEPQMAISCVFSPSSPKSIPNQKDYPNDEPPPEDIIGGIDAQAFTDEQYKMAEMILEAQWDRTHFLENLSGTETSCSMLQSENWEFVKSRDLLESKGMKVYGLHGTALNEGSTPAALKNILRNLKKMGKFSVVTKIGCSLIPDCIFKNKMWVVLSCLYQTEPIPTTAVPDEPIPIRTNAEAFTKEEYKMAEMIFGTEWDRTHFLENLSGTETSCNMLQNKNWEFDKSRDYLASREIKAYGLHEAARNQGSTPAALENILLKLKKMGKFPVFTKIGCSLISDCWFMNEMWVVASCLYQTD